MSRREKAMELFLEGYNCTQAVVGAFSDMLPMDYNMLMKMSSGFGGGMSRLREVCGAVSGMVFVANTLYGYSEPKRPDLKMNHYAQIQSLANEFKDRNGSYICRELLGLDIKGADSPVPEERTPEYYKKRPCKELIGDAAEILEEYIKRRSSNECN